MTRVYFFISFCLFANLAFSSDWERVYLASFPRSGNHWVRFLIEEATHIATSSVYKDGDYPHLRALFPWGGYSTDHGYTGTCRYPVAQEPVVVKTHYPYYTNKPLYPLTRASICLIRHPIDVFHSFYLYKQKKEGPQNIPIAMLQTFIQEWRKFYEFWDKQEKVLLIRYEDLYQEPSLSLAQILQAIGYPAQPADIRRAVGRYPPQGTPLKHLPYYTQEDLALIRQELGDLLVKYGYDL